MHISQHVCVFLVSFLWLFSCLFYSILVCLFLCCFINIVIVGTCLYSNEREKKRCDFGWVGKWGGSEGSLGEGKPWLEYVMQEKNQYFQFYDLSKNSSVVRRQIPFFPGDSLAKDELFIDWHSWALLSIPRLLGLESSEWRCLVLDLRLGNVWKQHCVVIVAQDGECLLEIKHAGKWFKKWKSGLGRQLVVKHSLAVQTWGPGFEYPAPI